MNTLNVIALILVILIVLVMLTIILFKYHAEKLNNIKDLLDDSEKECIDELKRKNEIISKMIKVATSKFKCESTAFDEVKDLEIDNLDSFKDEKKLIKCYEELVHVIEDNPKSKDLKTLKDYVKKYENNDLATHIASDIDDVCSASNTCSTTTTGTSTIPGSSPHPASGSGKGTFTGAKATMETKLKSCFSSMNSMVTGGNMYFAQEFAVAVYNYLKNGTIAITLQAPMSGAGSGGIQ